MAPKTAFEEVPQSIQDWRSACKKAGVQRRSINSFLGIHSGSEMTQEQYLLMRVLYPKQKHITAFAPAMYGLAQDHQAATTFLQASPAFQTFLQTIRTNPVFSHTNLDLFAIPRMNQLLIQPATRPPATNPPISRISRSR